VDAARVVELLEHGHAAPLRVEDGELRALGEQRLGDVGGG
jgi:hypothetical protein